LENLANGDPNFISGERPQMGLIRKWMWLNQKGTENKVIVDRYYAYTV